MIFMYFLGCSAPALSRASRTKYGPNQLRAKLNEAFFGPNLGAGGVVGLGVAALSSQVLLRRESSKRYELQYVLVVVW